MVIRVVWSAADDASHAERRELARELLRTEVATLLDLDAEGVRVGAVCARCGGPHGRPVVVLDSPGNPPWVSITRSSGVVVVAVSTTGPVGVDAEKPRVAGVEIGRVALHAHERADDAAAMTTTWVRKESVLKMTGLGMTVSPSALVVSDPAGPPALLRWELPDELPSPVWMTDIQLDGSAVACVAVTSARRPEVSVRRVVAAGGASLPEATQ